MRWPWHRRRVTCATCGYVCVREVKRLFLGERALGRDWRHAEYDIETLYHELTPDLRDANLAEVPFIWDSDHKLCCRTHAYELHEEFESRWTPTDGEDRPEANLREARALASVLHGQRSCRFWYRYQRGFGPQQHLDLEQRDRAQRAAVVWGIVGSLAGAITGGALTVLGALLVGR